MKYRLLWVQCPDCGRSSERPGGCFVVERRGLFGWGPFLITYDRGGSRVEQHFPSEHRALSAHAEATARKQPTEVVIKEWRG